MTIGDLVSVDVGKYPQLSHAPWYEITDVRVIPSGAYARVDRVWVDINYLELVADREDYPWFSWKPTADLVKRPKCDCGAAAVGGIPHSHYCSVSHLESIAKKREPRNEWD